jgi:F-type H+-transporting ATPase subunit beta
MPDRIEGRIVQVIGPVVDVEFDGGYLPAIYNAVDVPVNGRTITTEVAQHLGENQVRCVAMASVDGVKRGGAAYDT